MFCARSSGTIDDLSYLEHSHSKCSTVLLFSWHKGSSTMLNLFRWDFTEQSIWLHFCLKNLYSEDNWVLLIYDFFCKFSRFRTFYTEKTSLERKKSVCHAALPEVFARKLKFWLQASFEPTWCTSYSEFWNFMGKIIICIDGDLNPRPFGLIFGIKIPKRIRVHSYSNSWMMNY
jgi:hypothetical protein